MVLSGLPMYTSLLNQAGFTTLNSLSSMSEQDLRSCGITDQLHLDIILSAIKSTWGVDQQQPKMPNPPNGDANEASIIHV